MSKLIDQLNEINEKAYIDVKDIHLLRKSLPDILELYSLAELINRCTCYDMEAGVLVSQSTAKSLERLSDLIKKFESHE
jgi:hypothetical protein